MEPPAVPHVASDAVPEAPLPVVRALDRGIALMRAFSGSRPRLRLSELAAAAGLDKGTARRLLATLRRAGMVEHDARAGLYALSVGVLEMAAAVETGRDLREIAAPHLTEIAERTGATAFLWAHHEGTALCLDRVRPPVPAVEATWFTVGTRTTLNCGGGPRALLAHLGPGERARALALPLVRRTAASETDPAALEAAAAAIRARGWEFTADDFVVGLSGLGVPVFDRRGGLAGALSISTLTGQMLDGDTPRHLGLMLRAAKAIGARVA